MSLRDYKIEGVYVEIDTDKMIVPYDVVEHVISGEETAEHFVNKYLILYRPLETVGGKKYAVSLKDFNLKFKTHEGTTNTL